MKSKTYASIIVQLEVLAELPLHVTKPLVIPCIHTTSVFDIHASFGNQVCQHFMWEHEWVVY